MPGSDVEMLPESKHLAYDPDQDPEEKRKVRKEYRTLHQDTEGVSRLAYFKGHEMKINCL